VKAEEANTKLEFIINKTWKTALGPRRAKLMINNNFYKEAANGTILSMVYFELRLKRNHQ
jgi:hypothetical protein